MTASSWYLRGAGGDDARFNWNKHPSYSCPNADPVSYSAAATAGAEGTWTLLRPEVAAAAAAIGADPIMLGKLLRQRHASHQAGRLRIDERLTDRCAICGAKMTRKGFRAWIDQSSPDEASQRVAGRLGLHGPRTTLRTTWHDTKREAEAWARHERKRAQPS